MTDPFDPVNMAARHLFNAGQVEAQANRIEQLKAQVAALKAENERLRKAGDNLEYLLTSKIMSYEVGNASFEWRNAKGDKPTL